MTMDKNKPLLSQPNWLLWIPLLISALVLGAYVLNFVQQPLSDDAGKWGTFGDYFGGLLNPVIATCTLFVAVRVWQLQKIELKATQEALQEQAKTAEQQRGEQRFFDLLKVYLSTVDSLNYSSPQVLTATSTTPPVFQGRNAIDAWLRRRIRAENQNFSRDDVVANFNKQLSEFDIFFSAYFRTLTLILENLEELTGEQHPTFARLLRAQLSRAELTLIGLCLLFHDDAKRSIPAFEKYGILKHLPDSRLREEIAAKHPRTINGLFSEDPELDKKENPC